MYTAYIASSDTWLGVSTRFDLDGKRTLREIGWEIDFLQGEHCHICYGSGLLRVKVQEIVDVFHVAKFVGVRCARRDAVFLLAHILLTAANVVHVTV